MLLKDMMSGVNGRTIPLVESMGLVADILEFTFASPVNNNKQFKIKNQLFLADIIIYKWHYSLRS